MPLQSAFTNAFATAPGGGAPYCVNHPLPAAEGPLGDVPAYTTDPVVLPYAYEITAVVEFQSQASPSLTTNPYVVMQTDQGDGQWLDLAWCTLTAAPAPGAITMFVLSASVNANQGSIALQPRTVGTAPTPNNGSNLINLGQRFRFVGKASLGSSSSSSVSSAAPSLAPAILATIRWSAQVAR
jgi:hypothetical protein